jgi:hypothetical protein
MLPTWHEMSDWPYIRSKDVWEAHYVVDPLFWLQYDQLQWIVIDEISFIGNKMLTFIDHRLHVIKWVHNQFMGGLDIIVMWNLYKVPLVRDSWIFKI